MIEAIGETIGRFENCFLADGCPLHVSPSLLAITPAPRSGEEVATRDTQSTRPDEKEKEILFGRDYASSSLSLPEEGSFFKARLIFDV